MRLSAIAPVLALATIAAAVPARACRMPHPLRLELVRQADAVVVGRIVNYRIVLDQAAREERRRFLATYKGNLIPEVRRGMESQTSFLSDYARFDVIVDEVLAGRAGRRINVGWHNSTFGEPASMPPGRYLVALRRDPGSLTVLQATCSPPFLFPSTSEPARAVRRMLNPRAARP